MKDLPGIEELKAAGLIDQRPALTALSARGLLTDVGQGEDTDDPETGSGDGDSDADEPEKLEPDFGEDLVPETSDEGEVDPGPESS
ncbi:hypothetical protein SB769_36555, partial [Burkholderia sp. SIMBA_024]